MRPLLPDFDLGGGGGPRPVDDGGAAGERVDLVERRRIRRYELFNLLQHRRPEMVKLLDHRNVVNDLEQGVPLMACVHPAHQCDMARPCYVDRPIAAIPTQWSASDRTYERGAHDEEECDRGSGTCGRGVHGKRGCGCA